METRELSLFQVDAFAPAPLAGNPAAVVPLEAWLPDAQLQALADENHVSETAFSVPEPAGAEADFQLRWFTPTVEVDLCGHATLATAHVLFHELGWPGEQVRFSSASGLLTVTRASGRLELDFPATPPGAGVTGATAEAAAHALGGAPVEVRPGPRDLMLVYATQAEVLALAPDFGAVAALDARGVIVTAPGDAAGAADFVSRFFAPNCGVDEDPVTGSAHCQLTPYWAERLGKRRLFARQLHRRGGELWLEHRPETGRVGIAGEAHTVIVGTMRVPSL